MTLTKVVGGVIADTTITSTDILDSTITNAKMALSPANASNLSSGSVPAAQLTLAPDPDLTAQKGDIALLGFKTQTNGNLARYNLVDQFVDAFEDTSGVDASASTDEYRDSTGKYYSGTAVATGGTITTHGAYTVHSFITAGNENFVVGSAGNVDYLLVAGGGGAGSSIGGGGGGGGVRSFTSQAVTAQTYVITVGAGGVGSDYDSSSEGTAGGASTAFGNSAAGGGYGAQIYASLAGGAGGSGGGGDSRSGPSVSGNGGAGNTPSTSPVQGYAGGNGVAGQAAGAGGGGAGAVGANVTPSNNGGNGGVGIQNDYRTGSNVYYGGGGGGAANGGTKGSGGLGGGGDGVQVSGNNPENGEANTGGGAGGGHNSHNPAGSGSPLGGTGIVVIRYTGSLGAINNMTLVSNATTAESAPTKGDLVFTYTNGVGTAVLGTNITAEASMDNGSTWTDFGIGASDSQGTTGGHTIVTKNNVTLTSTSGTAMRYRIKTLVQSASLDTRIHAVSLGWS